MVEKLLEKDPDDRIQSAEEAADLLARHLAHLQQPESVPQPERVVRGRSRQTARRPRSAPVRSWLARVPIPAWLALLLFVIVYASALAEWTGAGQELGTRPNGFGFFVAATGFVLVWGLCSITTRLIRGPATSQSDIPPTANQVAAFFAVLVLVTGVFVWHWTELGNRSDRERMLGYFFGHGWLMLELRNPETKVLFNGRELDVPPDGRVVIRPEHPGSYTVEATNDEGWLIRSENLVHDHLFSTIGVAEKATRVTVSGPARGSFEDN